MYLHSNRPVGSVASIVSQTDILPILSVLTRPEDIRSVFKDSDTHRKAADNNAGWLMGEILGKCLGLISGPHWRTLHAVMGTPFLRKNSVKYISRIEQQTKRYFKDLCVRGRLDQGLLNPVDDLKLLPFWITAEIIYGELPPEAEQKLRTLIPLRESLFRLMITGKLTRFKLYKYLPTTANRELSEFKKGWSDFNSKAYQHAVANNTSAPLVYMYESATRREITFEQLLQTLDEILFANLDVTMGALSWNLLFLGAHHDFQASLRAEILAKREESHGDVRLWEKYLLSSTTLLAVAVLESARLKPLAAFSVPQAAPTERNVGGFIVPAGTNFIIDSLALNVRNPFWGQDTLDYRPTRFFTIQNTDIRYYYWRFGFGPRTCMGRHVADLLLRIILVQLVEGYRLSLVGHKSDWQRNDKTWILHPNTDIRCENL